MINTIKIINAIHGYIKGYLPTDNHYISGTAIRIRFVNVRYYMLIWRPTTGDTTTTNIYVDLEDRRNQLNQHRAIIDLSNPMALDHLVDLIKDVYNSNFNKFQEHSVSYNNLNNLEKELHFYNLRCGIMNDEY